MNSDPPNPSSPFAVVVNDDSTQLKVLCGLVRKAGLKPRAFTTAVAALADMSARAGTRLDPPPSGQPSDKDIGMFPKLVVTDLYMPGIDGWRFCRLLRSPEYAAFNQIPILVVSATFAGDEANRIADDLGAEAFLPSPVEGKRFVELVRAILSGKRVRTPLRVLVVEDSQTLADIIKKSFAAHGYQADTALTARAAVDAFTRTAYDAAVLDYHLPDGTGDALLDTFRAQQPDCVCLMMTTDTGPELALDWMKRGAAAYLKKPFQPDYLIELCARARRERALLRVQDLIEVRTRELRQSEKELLREQLLMKTLLDSLPGIFYLYSYPELRLIRWNKNHESLLGFGPGEINDRPILEWHIPEAKEAVLEAVEVIMEKGQNMIEAPLLTKDGRLIPFILTGVKLEVSGQTYLMGVGTDITERKRTEEEKAKLEDQLQQSQKMESVGRLAGGVAHDFNNMLGAILGHSELAIEQVDPAHRVFANLQQIQMAAKRSADLTRQLLAFARKQTVAPKVLDLNETVTGMLNMLERLIGENIELNWQPEADLWPVKVDPSQIDQLLANLCVNARDAISGVGKLTIETGNSTFDEGYCAAHAGFAPGQYAMLAVSDDGCGLDKETQAFIFEPFFTTKEMGKGTGLGLATVYGIVKQNNGFINVHSEPGQGTTFTIYLPRHMGTAARMQMEAPREPDARGHETILLVEDEPAILELITIMLERQGYTILAAPTPGEAIRLAREHAGEIHLLMTDVVMPEMNGRDLAKNLLSLYPHLKRLFMSGYTANVIAHHGVLDEGVYFIQKPFSINELAAKVREVMNKN